MSFLTDLDPEFLEDVAGLKLNEEFVYFSDRFEELITVPVDFVCDGASIPRFLWTIVGHPLQPKVVDAAVVHDYIYGHRLDLSRKVCDQIFYEAMQCMGVNPIKAHIFYRGVRIGGGSHRKQEEL